MGGVAVGMLVNCIQALRAQHHIYYSKALSALGITEPKSTNRHKAER
jgi:hypothetical protein